MWRAISEDTELRRWFAPEAKTESAVGGEIVWAWRDHHNWPQRIEILEPGRRLRTRYDSGVDVADGGKAPLFLDFMLEGEGGMTTLRLVQSGFGPEADFDSEYDGISRGWPVELRSLRLYLEQHAGQDRQLVWSVRDLEMDPTEAWARLTSADGMGCGTGVENLEEGAAFRFRTVDGDEFAGKALCCQDREFSGEVTSHGGAFFRVSVEEWGGLTHVWLWLGTYGRPASEVVELQEQWDAMLERLFVVNGKAAVEGLS